MSTEIGGLGSIGGFDSTRIEVVAIPESDSKLHDAKFEDNVLTIQKMEYLKQKGEEDVVVDLTDLPKLREDVDRKVEKELTGDNGKSLIFNEKDGGGAKFEGTDFRSYVGVHDGSENIPAKAQIYAIKNSNNTGVIIDVTEEKAFYNNGEVKPATERDVKDREIAVKGDFNSIKTLLNENEKYGNEPLHITYFTEVNTDKDKAVVTNHTAALKNDNTIEYKDYSKEIIGATEDNAGLLTGDDKALINNVKKILTLDTKHAEEGCNLKIPYKFGLTDISGDSATITDYTVGLNESGKGVVYNEYSMTVPGATELTAGLMTAGDKVEIESLRTDLTSEVERAKREESKKVEKELTGTNGKGLVFNEADGGGVKFEHTDGTNSFVGVNDEGSSGIAGQIYVVNKDNTSEGCKINLEKDKFTYIKNKATSERNEDDEIATLKDIKNGKVLNFANGIGVNSIQQNVSIESGKDLRKFTSNVDGLEHTTQASGQNAVLFGGVGEASAKSSFVIGRYNVAETGNSTFATGEATKATGRNATTFGNKTQAKGNNSIAMGQESITEGTASFAGGINCKSSGNASVTFGVDSTTTANCSFALGKNCTNGDQAYYSLALGKDVNTTAMAASGLGLGLNVSGYAQTVVGFYNEEKTNAAFIVGNGRLTEDGNEVRTNAFEVYKDGEVKLGFPIDDETNLRVSTVGYVDKKVNPIRNLLKGDNSHTGTEQIRIPYFFDVNPEANDIKVTARGVSLNSQDQIVWEDTATERNTISINGATSTKAGLMTATDKVNLDNLVIFDEKKVDKLTGTYQNDQIYVHTTTGSEISVNLLKAKTSDVELAKNSVYTADVVNQFMEQVSADKIIPFTEDFIVIGTPIGGITTAQNLKGWSLKKIFTDMFNGPEPPPEE